MYTNYANTCDNNNNKLITTTSKVAITSSKEGF